MIFHMFVIVLINHVIALTQQVLLPKWKKTGKSLTKFFVELFCVIYETLFKLGCKLTILHSFFVHNELLKIYIIRVGIV